MDIHSIVCDLLGLQELKIKNLKLYKEKTLRAVIYAEIPLIKARCSTCENQFYEVHQWHEKIIKVPPLGIFQQVTLALKYPRGICSFCLKVRSAQLKGIHSKFKGLSCSFVELSGRMMEEATCATASRWFHCSPSLMWKVDQWRMEYLKSKIYHLPKTLDCSYMSADEVHFLSRRNKKRKTPFSPRWVPEFITNLVNTKHSKIIANASGRDKSALERCLKELTKDQRLGVEYFAIDMNQGYFSAIKKLCPKANICVDRFHLVQMMNKYVDKVRSQEYRKAKQSKDQFQMTMLGPSRRYLIMENRNNKEASLEEMDMLNKLKIINDNIHNAILITDYFNKILDHKSIKKFRVSLVKWYQVVRQSKSKIFREFSFKVKKYRRNIEAYIQSNLTTAVSEGLNNKIKVLRRAGYNYTNKKSYQNKILQRCGFLNSSFLETNHLFWHVNTPQI
ncbi:MAG: ISL3 family transposase [Candidatus Omnitrophica bacterium]|nr:ISL3 family transposase [Candidatus Omnitrophota bacterium]